MSDNSDRCQKSFPTFSSDQQFKPGVMQFKSAAPHTGKLQSEDVWHIDVNIDLIINAEGAWPFR